MHPGPEPGAAATRIEAGSAVVDRRALLGAGLAAMVSGPASSQPARDSIDLWPAAPPGGPAPSVTERITPSGSITGITRPRLNVFRPADPNGTSIVVMAGGGYVRVDSGNESGPACRWLQTLGVTAYELIYRLPHSGWPPSAPFQDAQRAIRLVRAQTQAQGATAPRIGVLGFSAGGHLAGMSAVRAGAALYPSIDAADSVSARPDFAGLIYPVLSLLPPFDHTRSRREIVGHQPNEAESTAYSVERHVDRLTPPTFLAHAADDPISAVDNSLMMFDALRRAHVPAELHVFQTGGHGWGMGRAGSEVHAWPDLFAAWLGLNSLPPAPPEPL